MPLEEFLGKYNLKSFNQIFMKYKYKEIESYCLCYNLWVKQYQPSPLPPVGDIAPLKFQKSSAPAILQIWFDFINYV